MEINIGSMMTTDLPQVLSIDHSYHTDHVWQMELDTNDSSVSVCFRDIRLPVLHEGGLSSRFRNIC